MRVIRKPGPNGATLSGVVAALKGINGVSGKVGWFAESRYPTGVPVALVAATQELGTGKIPPRPFMRPTISGQQNNWKDWFAKGYRSVLRGSITPQNVMEQVAGRAAGDVRKTISDLVDPPLKPATIAARARARGVKADKATATFAKPLVFTGRLLNTLTHQVETK